MRPMKSVAVRGADFAALHPGYKLLTLLHQSPHYSLFDLSGNL